MTPIPKKPPLTSPSNFRPISITSLFARLFEKILKKRIVAHLEACSVISPNQHGFQKGKSTITAMLQNLNKWTASLDKGKGVDVIYFDFTKAFDKVPHQELIEKLRIVGVHLRIVAWVAAFLRNRTFSVRINEHLSKPRAITSGVPQGGVLSPILFSIYRYELANILSVEGSEFSAFADDIKIFRTVNSDEDFTALQLAINALQSWSTT